MKADASPNSTHFVAYHNSDERGPYYDNVAARKPKEGSFVTAKPFRKETLMGQFIWAFEGAGSPKRYSLVGMVSSPASQNGKGHPDFARRDANMD